MSSVREGKDSAFFFFAKSERTTLKKALLSPFCLPHVRGLLEKKKGRTPAPFPS
jgi:hypothetical protein